MIEAFADVDVSALAAWIESIPVHEWRRLVDPTWMRASERTWPIAKGLMEHFPECELSGVGLFLLDPGQEHPPHTDEQPPEWVTRVHVPVITNPKALARTEDGIVHMAKGIAYRFNTRRLHAVANDGDRPRIHLVFDIVRKNG